MSPSRRSRRDVTPSWGSCLHLALRIQDRKTYGMRDCSSLTRGNRKVTILLNTFTARKCLLIDIKIWDKDQYICIRVRNLEERVLHQRAYVLYLPYANVLLGNNRAKIYTLLCYMHTNRRNELAKYIISLAFRVVTYEFRGHRYVPTIRSNRTDAHVEPLSISFFAHWGLDMSRDTARISGELVWNQGECVTPFYET